jgi:cytochrome b subunit of formate dehydrogenase
LIELATFSRLCDGSQFSDAQIEVTLPPEGSGEPLNKIEDYVRVRSKSDDRIMKLAYGWTILVAMAVVLIVTEYLFWQFLTANDYRVGASIVDVWLSATATEIFGALFIVTRYLFPRGSL